MRLRIEKIRLQQLLRGNRFQSMRTVTSKQLHSATSAILDEVERGRSFQVTRHGKVIGELQPASESELASWAEIMGPVWEAQKECKSSAPNPVLEERQRSRR